MNGLLIGRFQPFHLGHLDAIKFALSKADMVWLGIGSSDKSHEKENPFTAQEREKMILSSINPDMENKLQIYHIPDLENHKKWIENLDKIVPQYQMVFSNDEMTRHLYSHRNIEVIPIPFTKRDELSGTTVRKRILADQDWEHLVPEGTKKILQDIGSRDRLLGL